MVIRIKKIYVAIFIILILLSSIGVFYFTRGLGADFSKKLNNKSGYYKEVISEATQVSDEDLEATAFSIVEKLSLDLGEPIEVANIKSIYGDGYNYDLVFSRGNIQLDESTGDIVAIVVNPEKKDESTALTEEELIKKASEYYNILDCPSEYEIRSNSSLGNNYYNVIWEKQYDNNLYSKYESVNMVLNEKTGELTKVTISNVPKNDEKENKNIDKNEAEKSISSFKELKGYNYRGKIEKQIVIPNTTYLTDEYENANYSKTAWVAEFNGENGEEAYVYIDTANGKIIGGVKTINWL